MEINIYWNDLSQEGQETLINSGFILLEEHETESKPIGTITSK